MDWFAPLDLYCERLEPGLWGEPVNAVSNLAFFFAAGLAARSARRRQVAANDGFFWSLIGLVAVIGAGSLAFHTAATVWGLIADTVPITLFVYAYFLFSLRRFLNMGWAAAIIWTAVYFVASWGFGEMLPHGVMNGSGSYLPALVAMTGIGSGLIARGHPAGHWLAGAGGLFLISLTFRTIDGAICQTVPLGVHFLWHLCNALVLWLLLEAAVRFGRHRGQYRPDALSPPLAGSR